MNENYYLGELKKVVLYKAGITSITPADCRYLSAAINKATRKFVSETTLKRLFGFADAKHHFSLFTLTSICEYAGLESWDRFKKEMDDLSQKPGTDSWTEFRGRADKITGFTLKTIRNRSGIPYALTTDRKFAETDLDYFMASEMSFTCLVSQPGYGKSILLCRMVEQLFRAQDAPYKDDVVWFMNTSILQQISSGALTLENWLSLESGFGYKISFSDYFNRYPAERKGKVVVVIDGFDDVLFKRDQVERLFDAVIDFICENEDNPWLKVILSMRSNSWLTFYDRIRESAYLGEKWYPGCYFRHDDVTNVPPLSDNEVSAILRKIDSNFTDLQNVNPNLKKHLRFPYYLQLYYQISHENQDLDYHKSATFYELVSDFIRQKIYSSGDTPGKVAIIREMIRSTAYGKNGAQLYSEQFEMRKPGEKLAFTELLQNGILAEEKHADQSIHNGIVRFTHQHIFEYFLSMGLIEKYAGEVSDELLEHVLTEYRGNPVKVQILQWVTRYTIVQGRLEPLRAILALELPPSEKCYLLLFIAEVLVAKTRCRPELSLQIVDFDIHQAFLAELSLLNYSDPFYHEIVRLLSLTTNEKKYLYTYHAVMGCIAVLKLDLLGIKTQAIVLQKLNYHFEGPIDPLLCLNHLHMKLSGQQDVAWFEDMTFEQVNRFIHADRARKGPVMPEQSVAYMSMLLVNAFSGDMKTISSIICRIRADHPGIFYRRRSGFAAHLLLLQGVSFAGEGDPEHASKIERHLSRLEVCTSEYSKHNFANLLLLRAVINKEVPCSFIKYMQQAASLFKNSDFMITRFFMSSQMLKYYRETGDLKNAEAAIDQLKLIIEEKGVSADLLNMGVFNTDHALVLASGITR
ncbi:hypothetical protein [Hufsiella ginkgonis]|uniref:NACHT domain-containing protein n=1 Tax=Hufsiella ginkgonis TaxID=2695274 RepID=A0A7K1Y288_9SPHI|nr:hypothetical protein [Hufsiella ginkgonis]MXV17351.1 hypothetical protein [Hufsiella ginkgonis]